MRTLRRYCSCVVLALVPSTAKIIHPVFAKPIAVEIVGDGCVTLSDVPLSGNGDGLRWVQPQIRHRHRAGNFASVHGITFLDQR
jgi:hypothetical protein